MNMQSILIVWLALLIERLVPISSRIDPLGFFKFVCQQMANKLIKRGYTQQQLVISGSLALFVLLSPLLIIVYLLQSFASYQWLFDTILLWLLFQYSQDINSFCKSMEALKTSKKQLAKNLMQEKLLRNTQNLSPLGLTKASVESIFLRYNHQQLTIIICYILLGPVAALGYRLCYETHQAWNIKHERFEVFGRLANMLTRAFQVFPSILLSISFVALSTPSALAHFCKQKQMWALLKNVILGHGNQSMLLFSLAYGLKVKIGGPVIYGKTKYTRPRFANAQQLSSIKQKAPPHANGQPNGRGYSSEPTVESVKVLITLLNRHLIVCLLFITWIIFWYIPA
jgi:adenosylcobinamide-phosphate synthase